MERSIVDLEKKVADLTREVTELNERTARNEKALETYLSGSERKPVQEEVIAEEPATAGETGAPRLPA